MSTSTSALVDPEGITRFLRQKSDSVEKLDLRSLEELRVEPLGEGHSNLTFRVRIGDTTIVLRRPPRGEIHGGTHEMWREFVIMQALADSEIPVPRPIVLCEDASFIGAPFFLMELVDGVVARSHFPDVLQPHAAAVGFALANNLAAIHSFDFRIPSFERLVRKPEQFLDRNIRRMGDLLEAVRHRDVGEIDELGAWIQANKPTQREVAFTHGDYKLDNVILSTESPGHIAAVVDWEIATVGDPMVDVGWMLFFHGSDDDNGFWQESHATKAAGYPSRAELARAYTEASGRDLGDLVFYIALAAWKIAIIMEGSYRRFVEGMADDPMFESLDEAVLVLARRGLAFARGELTV